ncbi:MAG: peptidoglycan synthetase [Bacteroidetes bacterium 4484_276]|nr:MAG: peptidoglycan synthetase [Bacteroidetes bacterium 4484_276]
MKTHFIAIGGAVMHNLAIALKLKGYTVTGSDDEIFDPAKSNLKKHGLLPKEFGWHPEKITNDLDAIILGMHAKNGNPELDRAVELGLKIYSFPEYLYEQSKNKKRAVVAGSHGKTTITSMIMHVLKYHNMDFDYLVGSRIEGFDIMVRLSDAPVIVIEGDEYLTSALDPRPKFLHYKPHIALISGIAWDHINVFPEYSGYLDQFKKFMLSIEKDGSLIYFKGDDELPALVEECRPNMPKNIEPYGTPDYDYKNGKAYLYPDKDNHSDGSKNSPIPLEVFGRHNMTNLNGARKVCLELGLSDAGFYNAIRHFKGAANRLELLAKTENTTVFKDFAHAPSKLKATVNAAKELYEDRQLVAVMELHTYSSLSKQFLYQYKGSMDKADIPVVFFTPHAIALKKLPPITVDDVKKGFENDKLKVFTDASGLEKFLRNISFSNKTLLMMSSGNFGGLDIRQLAEDLAH